MNILLFLFISFFAIGAWAQTQVSRDTITEQALLELPATEQRRADLRSALKTSMAAEVPSQEPTLEKMPVKRRLTEQQRARLRQQLRQQQPNEKLDF